MGRIGSVARTRALRPTPPPAGRAAPGHLTESGSREEDRRAGEVAPIQEWLAERVHRHARRLDTTPLIQRATGRVQEVEPFLRFLVSD